MFHAGCHQRKKNSNYKTFEEYPTTSIGKVKHELQIRSSNPQVTISNPWVTSSNLRVKSSNLQVTSLNLRVTSSSSRVTSSNPRVRMLKALVASYKLGD